MSTTALHIIQLVKSLPLAEQQAINSALSSVAPSSGPRARAVHPPFGPEDLEGLSDDDPFFKVMEEIEQQRHAHVGRPAPELD
jgi:hypothetical protein